MNSKFADQHPSLMVRDDIKSLSPYSSGRDAAALRRETGFTGQVIKLASNEGANGPFVAARSALEALHSSAQRYPEAHSMALCGALADIHRVSVDEIIVGAGGCSLIAHLSSAYLQRGDEVLFGTPTFHLYRLEALRMGAVPVGVPLTAHGAYDLQAMRAAIGPKTRLVYICSPNNPTGGLVSPQELRAFIDDLPARVLPIIDEAYFEYVQHADCPDPIRISRYSERPVVVLRTFSKIFGLAGLRVGYLVAPTQLVAMLRRIQNPYEVNRAAQISALASLSDVEELLDRRFINARLRDALVSGLRELELRPLASQGNFVCVRVGAAKTIVTALEARGVIVRPLDAMGDPHSIRITVGTARENTAFLLALREVVHSRASSQVGIEDAGQ